MMQTTMELENLRMTLPELLDHLTPGDEVILTRNRQRVAKLVGEQPQSQQPRVPGLGKGMITILADDDEHLQHFAEYMP